MGFGEEQQLTQKVQGDVYCLPERAIWGQRSTTTRLTCYFSSAGMVNDNSVKPVRGTLLFTVVQKTTNHIKSLLILTNGKSVFTS